MMDRILYYDGKSIKIFHWENEKLLGSYCFMGDSAGQNLFRQYLLASHRDAVSILMDVREEDYFQESIPRVSARDRNRIIRRRLQRQYPDTHDWSCIQYMGCESKEGSDDKAICNVQTRPKDLEPWLDIIIEAGVPIKGICNLPFLSRFLMEKLAITDQCCLLVSQQSAS